jgi:Leucine Rich repeat
MSVAPEPNRPRRRFGLRLWGLMVVVLTIGLGLGWLKYRLRSQREAVDAVERAGGWIYYDYMKENSPNRRPYGPTWLNKLVGPDSLFLFSDVVEVRFLGLPKDDEPVDDSLMPYLALFSRLERLDLGDTHHVTGLGLRHIRGLTKLEVLEFPLRSQSDADLSSLANLKKLRVLRFDTGGNSNAIGDVGLRNLAGLTELEELDLTRQGRITDVGLTNLAGLTKLKFLSLGNLKVTDEGLVHLRGLTNLTRLYLYGTRVTNEGMAHVAQFQLLEYLDLNRTNVGDAGIMRLKGLQQLDSLVVGEHVTSNGRAEIMKALPRLRVY